MENETQVSDDIPFVWAIVDTGTLRVLGRIAKCSIPGHTTIIKDALIIRRMTLPILQPTGPNQISTVGMQLVPQCEPVDAEEGPTTLLGVVHNIRFFEDMRDKGDKYKMLYDNCLDMITKSHAHAAGIHLAPSMPKGGGLIG